MFRVVTFCLLTILTAAALCTNASFAKEDKFKVVIEESYYVVKAQNKEEFLKIYKTRLIPFWNEMQKRDISGRMLSFRFSTLS